VAGGRAEVWGRSRSTMAEAPPDTIDRVLLFRENGDGSGPLNDGDKCDDDARRTGFLVETGFLPEGRCRGRPSCVRIKAELLNKLGTAIALSQLWLLALSRGATLQVQ